MIDKTGSDLSGNQPATGTLEPGIKSNNFKKPALWLMVFGPGLMVMLADTDAGSLITAA